MMTATMTQVEIPAGFAVVDVTASVQHYHDGDSWYRGEVVRMFNPVTQAETVAHFGTDAKAAEWVGENGSVIEMVGYWAVQS